MRLWPINGVLLMNENVEFNLVEKVSDSECSRISAGAMLRSAREAEGLQLLDLAVSLKVPVGKLEALESDRFELLPDAVFTRALAASICRTLKIDSTLILERLPSSDRPSLKTDESGINAPFRTAGDGNGALLKRLLLKPFSALVLILVVGVVVMFFLPATPFSEIASSAKQDEPKSLFPLMVAEDTPNVGKSSPPEEVTQTESINSTSSNSNSASSVQVTAVAATAASVDRAVSVPTVSGSSTGASEGLVVFTGHGTSWIEVVDKQGVVQVRKTIHSGEVIAASGAVPLTIVVGRSDATDVLVRGQPFDLLQISKDNVARFEVK